VITHLECRFSVTAYV